LQEWRAGAATYPEVRAELAELRGIEVRQITSVSPDKFGGFGVNLKILATLLPLAIGVAVLAHADILYMCGSVVALRLYQSVPYWRYRDVAPVFPQAGTLNSSKAMSASAAGDRK
jgi:hypothetical protein